jgi:hypothetical protein
LVKKRELAFFTIPGKLSQLRGFVGGQCGRFEFRRSDITPRWRLLGDDFVAEGSLAGNGGEYSGMGE